MTINKNKFSNKVDALAEEYFSNISNNNLRYFAENAKNEMDTAFDSFVNKTYLDKVDTIEDTEKGLLFSDVNEGYRPLMKRWLKNNPIEVQMAQGVDEILETQKNTYTYGGGTLGVGTLITVGISVFSSAQWLAIITGLLTLPLSYKMYKKGEKLDQEYIEEEIEKLKYNYRNAVKKELLIWASSAEQYSKSVLENKYKII